MPRLGLSSRAVDREFNVNEPTVCIKYVLTRVFFRNVHKARLNVGLLVTCDWFVATQFCISLGRGVSVFAAVS